MRSIYWKPEFEWEIVEIHLLSPIRYMTTHMKGVKTSRDADDSDRTVLTVSLLVDVDYLIVARVVENPLRQNRMLTGPQAFEAGFADALLEPVEFLDDSLALFLEKIEQGDGKVRPKADLTDVAEVCRKARARLDGQVHGAAPAP